MKLNDKTYQWIKWFVVIVLPACGTLYTALAKIWPCLPYADQIPATIMAFCTFLGAVLCISTAEYYRGESEIAGRHESSQAPSYGPEIADPDTGGTATVEEILADFEKDD